MLEAFIARWERLTITQKVLSPIALAVVLPVVLLMVVCIAPVLGIIYLVSLGCHLMGIDD